MAKSNESKSELRDPVVMKMIVVGVLILGLLIPLGWISGLVWERQARHEQVKQELSATWGGAQTLQGPILVVPFLVRHKDAKGKEVVWRYRASFLPDRLEIDGTVEPETRSRGIFSALLYRVRLRVSGEFARPDFGERKIPSGDLLWNETVLAIGIPDLRGMQKDPEIRWDDAAVEFRPGPGLADRFPSGMHAPLPGFDPAKSHRFAFEMTLTGADALRFVPMGKDNRVTLTSAWPDPSFDGAFLPVERSVGASGFDATWRVSYYARSFAQSWRNDEAATVPTTEVLAATAFGVRLIESVNFYVKADRSMKYGVLFVALTFLCFFLFEIMGALRLHPMQYLLVGLALCLFYALLLSISEHLGFALAYSIASAGTILTITGYAAKVLGGASRGIVLGAGLAALYGYLYVLLQLEDYALLLGALGLFVVLGTVMYVTRNVDWYGLGQRRRLEPAAAAE